MLFCFIRRLSAAEKNNLQLIWLLLCALGYFSAASPVIAQPSLEEPPQQSEEISLIDALERLRGAGLNVVYSSRLVSESMRVARPELQGDLTTVGNTLLATHGLTLQEIEGGIWVVTRLPSITPQRPSATAASTQELPLVEIYASRYRIGTQANTGSFEWIRTDMQELPGLNEDVLRVTQFLPGTANNGFSAKTHIRGGVDNETLVLFDDIPMHAPYHFKDFGAILGVFDPAVTQRADLYTGVYPARYGGRLSAVMDIAARQPSETPQHELGVCLLSARALSTGKGRLKNREVSWLVGGRRSVIKELSELVEKDDYQPEFSDLLLRGDVTLGPWTITLGGLFLDDRLALEIEEKDEAPGLFVETNETAARYRDSLLWLHVDRKLGDIAWRLSAANSERHTDRIGQINRSNTLTGEVTDIREANTQYLRLEARNSQSWTMGVEVQSLRAEYNYSSSAAFAPALADLFTRPATFHRNARLRARGDMWSLYGSYTFEPALRWQVDAGLRVAHYDYLSSAANPDEPADLASAFDSTGVSPRLAVHYAWNETLTIRANIGRMTQAERPDELSVADGDARFHGLQYADQWVLGVEQQLGDQGVLRFETYRKDIKHPVPRYENLLNPLSVLPELEVDRSRIAPDSSLLYGIELNAQLQLSTRWSGWGGYAWAEAKDRFGSLDVTRSWNQQHTVLAGLTWRQGPWTASFSARWHSGWRQTLLATDSSIADAEFTDLQRNASDWPGYFSGDLRLLWDYPTDAGTLRAHLDIMNVSQRSNACCTELAVQVSADTKTLTSRQQNWLPRYALFGVTWEF